MKRRSFLAMIGLSPLAAAGAKAGAAAVAPKAYPSIAVRGGQVSYEPYIDVQGLVPRQGARDEHGFAAVTHSFVDGEGTQRIVWIK